MRQLLLCIILCLPLGSQAANIDQDAALHLLAQSAPRVLIDVRTPEEFAEGALPGAQLIPHEQIARRIAEAAPDKDTPVVLYCRSGRRAEQAQEVLQSMGYRQVINAGGYQELSPALAKLREDGCSRC